MTPHRIKTETTILPLVLHLRGGSSSLGTYFQSGIIGRKEKIQQYGLSKYILHLRLRQLTHPQLRIHNLLIIPHWLSEKRSQRSNDAGAAVIRGPSRAVWFAVAGIGGGEGWIV